MRVRNAHAAHCDGLEPGAEGEVNEQSPGVKLHLRLGMLVAVLDEEPDGPAAESPATDAPPSEASTPVDSDTATKRSKRTG